MTNSHTVNMETYAAEQAAIRNDNETAVRIVREIEMGEIRAGRSARRDVVDVCDAWLGAEWIAGRV